MRQVGDDERRARLGRRHGLAPGAAATSPVSATEALTVLHATEPATVFLTLRARVPGLSVADVERALYDERSLVKQLAMRRTLFVFPRDLLPAAWGSAAARVAGTERARLAKDVVAAGITGHDVAAGEAWVEAAREAVLGVLTGEPDGLGAAEVRARVPMLDTPEARQVGGGTRTLTQLGATSQVVRARSTAHWRLSRYRWTRTEHWLGDVPAALSSGEGYAALVGRWLRSSGPCTEEDLVWWLGATKGIVRAALADLGAEPVGLTDGATGWLLPDDLDLVDGPDPWVALLPVLDPTIMGWKGRGWYLGRLGPALFDRNGNAGTTAWADGRVVGTWVQDTDGVVRLHLLERVPAAVRRRLDAEAERLTDWLDGLVVGTVYPSPAMKEARDGP